MPPSMPALAFCFCIFFLDSFLFSGSSAREKAWERQESLNTDRQQTGHLLPLHEDHLDVARARHVGVDAAVGAVGPTPHQGSTVHLMPSADWDQNTKIFRARPGCGR